MPPFNKWSANVPGTTYFLLVGDLTLLCINILLTAFDEEFAYSAFDERNRFRPAGVARFARSRGGHLHDDPRDGRFLTVGFLEAWLGELAAVEHGAIIQNLALAAQALGLGGFPHFAAHPYAWFRPLGFTMLEPSASRIIGAGTAMTWLLRLRKRDLPVPTPVGLERDGEVLLRAFCPPHYRSMEEAVLAVVEMKEMQAQGAARNGGNATAWRNQAEIQAGIPRPSDRAIEATIAYATYVYERYGRFPATTGPFRTLMAYQALHVDPDFYHRYYRPEALSETQRHHEIHHPHRDQYHESL